MKIKITHLKSITNPTLSLKIGQTILKLNHRQNQQRTLTNGSTGYKFDEKRAFQLEAERKKNEATIYASMTPIR